MNKMYPLFLLFILFPFMIFSQSTEFHFQKGIEKQTNQDFAHAIDEYNLAINIDQSNIDAYFNRGTCNLVLKNYDLAKLDFDKTIKLDSFYFKAYYSRATVFVGQQKYKEALPDLDKTIVLSPAYPNALTLRGQIRAYTGNIIGACEDYYFAKSNGDKQADEFIKLYCNNVQISDRVTPAKKDTLTTLLPKNERFELPWMNDINWKINSNQENEIMQLTEFIHPDESSVFWTELGIMIKSKGTKNTKLEDAMNMMYEQTKKNAPSVKLTFLEKNEKSEFPWIIFKTEAENYKKDNQPESELWFIIQGNQALYSNFIAIKKDHLTEDFQTFWMDYFKNGKILFE